MITYSRKAATTDVSVVIRIVDSTDGTPETGVVWNTSGIDIRYRREGATDTAITEATLASLSTAHSDGGFLHIGNGYYRVDLPDAACASGATGVLVHGTVTGMVVIGCYIQLVAYDPYDTVRLGLTAMPNVASGSAGAIITSGTGTAQLDVTSGVAEANVASIDAGAITASAIAADAIGASELAADAVAEIADQVWDEVQSGHTTAGTFGRYLDAQVQTIDTNVDTLLTRITSTLFSGITSLAEWIGLIAGKQTGDATARTELRATGAGSGTFDETTDSQEALYDTITLIPTEGTIADAVWDEAIAGHLTAGTTGESLNAAGGAGDPWITSLPGSYTSGQAGYIVGNNLDAAVSSRSTVTTAQVNTEVDTALADYDGPTYTELLNLFRVALRSDAATATDLAAVLTAINADLASGAGDYSNTTEALEAIRDRGDAAWITATGFSTLDAAGVRSAVGLASANLDTQLDAIPTATENADEALKRDWTSVTGEADRSTLNALRPLRNKWGFPGGTYTVYTEDDTTTAWTGTATTDAASDPVTSIDPA